MINFLLRGYKFKSRNHDPALADSSLCSPIKDDGESVLEDPYQNDFMAMAEPNDTDDVDANPPADPYLSPAPENHPQQSEALQCQASKQPAAHASTAPTAQPDLKKVVGELTGEVKRSVARKRLARFFQPRADGTFRVPDALLAQFKDPKQKELMLDEFIQLSLDKDIIPKRCLLVCCSCKFDIYEAVSRYAQDALVKKRMKRVRSKESSKELWVDGIFMSQTDMDEAKIPVARQKAIMEECKQNRGWVRRGLCENICFFFTLPLYKPCIRSLHEPFYMFMQMSNVMQDSKKLSSRTSNAVLTQRKHYPSPYVYAQA